MVSLTGVDRTIFYQGFDSLASSSSASNISAGADTPVVNNSSSHLSTTSATDSSDRSDDPLDRLSYSSQLYNFIQQLGELNQTFNEMKEYYSQHLRLQTRTVTELSTTAVSSMISVSSSSSSLISAVAGSKRNASTISDDDHIITRIGNRSLLILKYRSSYEFRLRDFKAKVNEVEAAKKQVPQRIDPNIIRVEEESLLQEEKEILNIYVINLIEEFSNQIKDVQKLRNLIYIGELTNKKLRESTSTTETHLQRTTRIMKNISHRVGLIFGVTELAYVKLYDFKRAIINLEYDKEQGLDGVKAEEALLKEKSEFLKIYKIFAIQLKDQSDDIKWLRPALTQEIFNHACDPMRATVLSPRSSSSGTSSDSRRLGERVFVRTKRNGGVNGSTAFSAASLTSTTTSTSTSTTRISS